MPDENEQAALTAVRAAHAQLLSAHKKLVGYRLPLAGIQRNPGGAVTELCAAQRLIAQAIAALELAYGVVRVCARTTSA